MIFKRIIIGCSIFVCIIILIVVIADFTIRNRSKKFIYDDIEVVPKNKVGLVLGTSKYLSDGSINYYFKYRIDAALELFKAGKIKYIVVSGDNSRNSYNEPLQMKEDLIAGGVPEKVIYLDYAGFRTLDSIVRVNKIFGQTRFTIISQKFHNERAVYIARDHCGLEAIAFNAKDVDHYSGFKTQLRERFARVKVFIDILSNKQPKFLGEEVKIE